MKRLIAAVFAVLSLTAASAYAEELQIQADPVWATQYDFVAPAQ